MHSNSFQVLLTQSLGAHLDMYSILLLLLFHFDTFDCYFLVDILFDLYYLRVDFIVNLHIFFGIIFPLGIFHHCDSDSLVNR